MKKSFNAISATRTALCLLIGMSLNAGNAQAQTDALQMSPGFVGNSVYYRLPKTRIMVTVSTLHTVYTPGELSRYAERYLRLDNVREQEWQEWSIQEMNLETTGTPDMSVIYSLDLGKKNGTRIQLNSDGTLRSVNSDSKEPAVMASAQAMVIQESDDIPDPYSFLTEEILQSASSAKMAELVAAEIYAIRDSRNMITRGEADYLPDDGESVIYVLQQLDRQEKALISLFSGTTRTELKNTVIEFDADSITERHILLRFSSRLGVLSADNLAGEPIWIDVLKPEVNTDAPLSVRNTGILKSKSPYLFYNVPGTAHIRVYDNRHSYIDLEKPISQFGGTTSMPKEWFSNGRKPEIIFDPATGSIGTFNE